MPPNPDPKTFEEAFSALQEVVRELESGAMSLDAALELVARGTRLAQICQSFLARAELRITRLPAESASPLADAPSSLSNVASDSPSSPSGDPAESSSASSSLSDLHAES